MNVISTATGFLSKILIFVLLFFWGSSVFAIDITQDPCNGESCFQVGIDEEGLPAELRTEDGEGIRETLIQAINYLLTFIGILLVIVIVYAGVLLIVSNGEEESMTKARKILLYAIAGVVLIILSYSIVTVIANIMSDRQTDTINDGGGSNGGGDSGGGDGDSGGSSGSGTEEIERQIQDLLDQIAALRAEGGNEELIAALQNQLDALQNQIDSGSTDALEQQIKDLQDALNALGDDPENEEERKKLQEQIDTLQNELYDASVDTQAKIEELLKQIEVLEQSGSVSLADIEALQKSLLDLKSKTNGNESLENKYKEIEALLNQLLANPDDEKILTEVVTEIQKLKEMVESLSEVYPRVIVSYSRRSVPTTVSLSGEKTYLRGPSSAVLKNEHYHWSVVGPDGVLQQIGDGITREFQVDIPGRYVFFMDVDAPADDVLSGQGIRSFTASPRETEVAFTAGEKTSFETLRFTQTQNTQGIIFNPSLVVPKSGRSIVRYVWNFGGYKVEENDGKPVLYSFPDTGKTYVQLEVTDNAGVKKRTARVTVEISTVDAYFKLQKSKYKMDEQVKFSAKKSKSDNGFIQEYDWEVIDENGSVVSQFAGEEFSTAFTVPGNYIVRLTVRDNAGESANYIQSFMVISDDPIAHFLATQKESSNPSSWTFNAGSSFDPSSSSMLYSWDFDGDYRYDRIDMTESVVTHQFDKQGPVTVRLKVKNQYGKEDTFSKKIEIDSLVQAEIESDKVIYTVGENADFSAASDFGESYLWNFDDGSGVQTLQLPEVQHQFEKPGMYLVSLVVKGRNGGEATDTKLIVVREKDVPGSIIEVRLNGVEQKPQTNLCGSGKHGIEVLRSDTLNFSGERSVNGAGKSSGLEYFWNVSGNAKSGETIPLSFPNVSSAGQCETVSLRVKDSRSGVESLEETLYVFVHNASPQLHSLFVSNPQNKIAPVSVPVQADASDDDGKIVEYTWWSERLGNLSNEKIGLHTTKGSSSVITLPPFGKANEENEYQFFVAVTDDSGEKISSKSVLPASDIVLVNNGDSVLPELSVTLNKSSVLMGENVLVTAFLKDDEGDDISDFASYKWDFDGDGEYEKDTTVPSASHQYDASGTYSVSVKALYQGSSVQGNDTVRVEKALKMPQAEFFVQKLDDGSILFSAENSKYDKSIEGNALKYEWDFGSENTDVSNVKNALLGGAVEKSSGPLATGKTVTHMYPSGTTTATVSLTVTNAKGESDTMTQTLLFDDISGVVAVSKDSETIRFDSVMQQLDSFLHQDDSVDKSEIDGVLADLESVDMSDFTNKQKQKITDLKKSITEWKDDSSVKDDVQSAFDQVSEEMGYERESAPLLSDKSMQQMSDLEVVLENVAKSEEPLGESDVAEIQKNVEALSEEIDEESPLYQSYQDLKNNLAILEQEPDNKEALEKVQESFKKLKADEQNNQKLKVLWKPLSEMGENINKSVQIELNTIATVLDVYGGERYIQSGEEIIFFVFVKNADGTLYSGPLELQVLEGEAEFQPPSLKSISGRGVGSFVPSGGGVTVIEVTAPDTVSGSISETLTFFVQE